jgi:tetraacyldisaccharide 4'-kinase
MENLRRYAPKADFFNCIQRIQAIVPFSSWFDSQKPHNLFSQPGTAFLAAAIGNPDRFRQDIGGIGIETRGCAFFRDHAVIGRKDWELCVAAARKAKAEAIIITEKDAVKISSPPDYPLFVAVQNTELLEIERFCEILQRCIRYPGSS